jgi:hypothetical protein
MFKFTSFRSTFTSNTNNETGSKRCSTSSIETTDRLTDPSIQIDDPLLIRLNHQRQLHEENSSRKSSCDAEVFVGWDSAEKDPFDLGSTSSEDDEGYDEEVASFNIRTKSQEYDGKANFIGWGEDNNSDMDETKSEELLVRELSIRGGLSETSDHPLNLRLRQHQNASEIDHSSLSCGSSKLRSSPESIDEDSSFVFDESTHGKASTALSSVNDSSKKSVSQVFRCTTKGDEGSKSPLPRRDNMKMFRRSTTTGSHHSSNSQTFRRPSNDSECDSRSSQNRSMGIRRRQSFSNLLSASLRNIGADMAASLKPLLPDIELQSQPSVQISLNIDKEEKEEECPRLQQLKEQSTEELHNELVRIQVQSKSNLESSWSHAERIRKDNDELDEKITRLKAKLEKAKAAVSIQERRNSPSQESCAASVSEVQPKLAARNFSSAARNTLFNFNDSDALNIRTRSSLDERKEKTKPKDRRQTIMGDFSSFPKSKGSDVSKARSDGWDNMSCASGSRSAVEMAIDDFSISERNKLSTSINRTLSRDESDHKSHASAPDDGLSDIRSAFDSLHSSMNASQINENTIFEAEGVKLKLADVQELLSTTTDSVAQVEAALSKQCSDLKTCYDTMKKSGEQVKKLRELESSTLHDMADFNSCFRAIDGKLQTIEAIAYDIKHSLEESTALISFNDVQLNNKQLVQAKKMVAGDSCLALEILNNGYAFHHYQDCRQKIVGNIHRMDFLQADLWNHLVRIRLLMEQVEDEEGTQTTESSMASERRVLERVFIEAILPHIQLAHLTKSNLFVAIQENVKLLKWWNHVVNGMECFKSCRDIAACVDFVSREATLSLEKDIRLLRRIIEVTSGYLMDIESDVKKECTSLRSKIERAGLSFNNSSNNDMFLANNKLGAKHKSLFQSHNAQHISKNKLLEKKRVVSEKDKLLKHHAAQLESLHSRSNDELTAQLEMLDKMQSQLQMFSNKMIEQDSLLSSLTNTHEKKVIRVLRLQKVAGEDYFMNNNAL